MSNLQIFESLSEAVELVLQKTAGNMRLAMPLGIGKPNVFINTLYKEVKANPQYNLTIFTALSLLKPQGASDLERRFLAPLVARLYGDYPDLEYVLAMKNKTLPKNVSVHEFFLKSGDWLNNEEVQQDYISANYTHIARDMSAKKVNVVAQAVAAKQVDGKWHLSLSSNPDVTVDLIERLNVRRNAGETIIFVAVVNNALPYMPGSAEINADIFDILITDDCCTHTLFCTPNMKVTSADYAIGLHASSLVQDGGTLQIGIGSLGDAIAQGLILRDTKNAVYQKIMHDLQRHNNVETYVELFDKGLYGCSEMFVNGLLQLIKANVIRREVADKQGKAHFFHGGFFIGPQSFYQTLRDMPKDQLAKIDMIPIAFINHLYGDEMLKREQRKKSAFINTCMMVTLSGSAVSDALDDGRVVSGVGGQYNFVAMAHELDGARSIMMLRSFRMVKGEAKSNIVTNYAHCTIPRHLRDIVITEYGIADLRGKSDAEVIEALIAIADSRFQEELRAWAIDNKKLPHDYEVPEIYANNFPESVFKKLKPYNEFLPDFPFGHDFTEDELVIIHALQKLKAAISHPLDNLGTLIHSLLGEIDVDARYIERMGFNESDTLKEKLLKKLFVGNI
jgi:acyl-CoA hydrolase